MIAAVAHMLHDSFRLTPTTGRIEPAGSFTSSAARRSLVAFLERRKRCTSQLLYVIGPIVVVVALILITSAVKILREYERAVVFTLGRFQKVKGPGLGPDDSLRPGNGARGFAHPGHRDTDTGRDLA